MAKKKEPRQLCLFSNIEMHNLTLDLTNPVKYLGRNGIHYEYVLPYGANRDRFQEEAAMVRSVKSATTKYENGKRPGQYQPLGGKAEYYFTFYQLKRLKDEGRDEYYINMIKEIMRKFYGVS
jgi:hypothetical protein